MVSLFISLSIVEQRHDVYICAHVTEVHINNAHLTQTRVQHGRLWLRRKPIAMAAKRKTVALHLTYLGARLQGSHIALCLQASWSHHKYPIQLRLRISSHRNTKWHKCTGHNHRVAITGNPFASRRFVVCRVEASNDFLQRLCIHFYITSQVQEGLVMALNASIFLWIDDREQMIRRAC